MKVTVKHEVKTCKECPFVTNEAREWDDPFTSSPADPAWWCTHKDRKPSKYLATRTVFKKIDENCPLKSAAGD